MKRLSATLFLALLAGFAARTVAAQEYPTRPITLMVPFAAGGPSDVVGRLFAQSMTKTLGQQVVVENVGGAGGTVGAGRVAKAAPDGYTLLLHHVGHATSPSLYPKLPYSPKDDFAPIGLIVDVPMTMIGRKTFGPNTLGEVIAAVRADGVKITHAHAGVGSAAHLCGLLFMTTANVTFTQVAYRGTGPAMNDVVGGQVDLMCDQTTNTTGQIQGGQVKTYVLTTDKRLDSLPAVPTAPEAGLPAFQVTNWHGLYAPKGTPAAVIAKVNAALRAALVDETVVKRFGELGGTPAPLADATPGTLAAKLAAEIDRWSPIIKAANAVAE